MGAAPNKSPRSTENATSHKSHGSVSPMRAVSHTSHDGSASPAYENRATRAGIADEYTVRRAYGMLLLTTAMCTRKSAQFDLADDHHVQQITRVGIDDARHGRLSTRISIPGNHLKFPPIIIGTNPEIRRPPLAGGDFGGVKHPYQRSCRPSSTLTRRPQWVFHGTCTRG